MGAIGAHLGEQVLLQNMKRRQDLNGLAGTVVSVWSSEPCRDAVPDTTHFDTGSNCFFLFTPEFFGSDDSCCYVYCA